MIKIMNFISWSTILQLFLDAADENEVGRIKSGGNEINLSNLSASKGSNESAHLISKNAKKDNSNTNSGGNNTKKSVQAAKGSNYLIPGTKKASNHLQHAFIQAPIFKHFDSK